MTTMMRETTTQWKQTLRTGEFWGKMTVLYMLVVAPALVVGAVVTYLVR